MNHATRGALVALALAWLSAPVPAAADEEKKMIADGSKVSIEYTLKLDDGSTADTNVGGEPLVYEQGKGQILPALEKELAGLRVDDTKKVNLSPAQGYGEIDPAAVQRVPASAIPEEARKVGAQLVAQDPAGQQHPVRVQALEGDQVVVDLNHPLAGKALHFDVKILAIQ